MMRQLPGTRELAEARAKLYRLLSAFYLEPPHPELLRSLAGWVAAVSGDEAPFCFLSGQVKRALDELYRLLKQTADDSWQELAEAASVEFTRLFRGVKRDYSPPPPYESLYGEDGERVFGEVTGAVLREYRRFRLEPADGPGGEPPDHIGFELNFMHFLCRREAGSWEKNDAEEAVRFQAAEHRFITEHLLVWLPLFCDEVRKRDRLGLYGALADLTEGWVAFDYEHNLQQTG